MKQINSQLFLELKRQTSNVVLGWLLTRKDGFQVGFTSGDQPFTYDGVTYEPTNAFSGTAAASKNNFSVDNMNAVALITDTLTEADLRGGKYDNARVRVFWIVPAHPEWGIVPIRGGRFGEVHIKDISFEVELRSLMQQLQQPFGKFYTLECSAKLGDLRCGVTIATEGWQPTHEYIASIPADARHGSLVKPTVYNGFWYECTSGGTAYEVELTLSGVARGTGAQINPLPGYFYPVTGFFALGFAGFSAVTGVGSENETVTRYKGTSGGTEPVWPTTLGGTVADGNLVWTAIQARVSGGTVSGVYTRAQFECDDLGSVVPPGYFKYGLVEWITGQNTGFQMEVRENTTGAIPTFYLLEPMPFPIQVGDVFVATVGCAKHREACKAFGNLINFRGMPDMPTEDKALQTPNFSSQGTPKQKGNHGS